MGRPKKKIKKEEIAEDYCFFCKDGGSLRVCDYKNCLKCYHPHCVGRDAFLLESEERWVCGWHFCFMCRKTAKFHCFCCQSAVCGRCLCDAEFALVKGNWGFCSTCLELALLIEDEKDVNSNGVKIDFKDTETYEYLFKGYWQLVKEREGLTSKQLHSSYQLLKDGKNYDFRANNYFGEEYAGNFDNDDNVSEYDDLSDKQVQCRKIKKKNLSLIRKKGKSKKKEFHGWASKELANFLMSIGKNVQQELAQHDVATIVTEYCKEHKLFHPEKKKKVICDDRLQSLLRRKSVNRNGIYKLLTAHFAENFEQSEDSAGFSSNEEEDDDIPCKRQRKLSSDRKCEEKEIALNPRQCSLAAIVSCNIKLVYLKRSLVQELTKQLDTFDSKIMGSFVRIKSNPKYDCFQKNSYMLVQVKGIKKTPVNEDMNSIILLQVSNMPDDVPVFKLSDDDFTEEEIEDLNRRMKSSLLKRPTVLELEQKARSLHEDITKHWIMKELVLLQSQINRAYEKGWRREFSEFSDRMQLLQMPSEQSHLIHEIPEVVADVDVAEREPASEGSPREDKEEHKALSESAMGLVSTIQTSMLENSEVSCGQNDRKDAAEGKQQDVKAFISDNHCHHFKLIATRVEGDEKERNQNFQGTKHSCPGTSVPQLLPQASSAGKDGIVYQEKQHSDAGGEKLNQAVDIGEHVKVESQVEVIELSDDEIQDDAMGLVSIIKTSMLENSEVSCGQNDGKDAAEGKQQDVKAFISDNHCHHFKLIATRVEGDEKERNQNFQGTKHSCPGTSVPQLLPQASSAGKDGIVYQEKQHSNAGGEKLNQAVDIEEHVKVESEVEVIELSDDEIQDDARVAGSQQTLEDPDCSTWYCIGPRGNIKGPYSMNVLKRWSESSICGKSQYKVLKSGQIPEEAIHLTDAIQKIFNSS